MPIFKQAALAITSVGLYALIAGCTMVTPTPVPTSVEDQSEHNIQKDAPIAVLTYVAGDVFVEDPTIGRRSNLTDTLASRTTASPFQPLYNGSVVRVSPGGSATVVCVDNHVYQISGGNTMTVTVVNCEGDQTLPANSASHVRPTRGRIKTYGTSSSVIEGRAR